MKCRKCRGEIPDGSKFCMLCGAKQSLPHTPKLRGNGQGSVYQLPNKRWIAVKTIGYEVDDNKKLKRRTRSKSGFRTKKEALEYLSQLTAERQPKPVTFAELYTAWLPTHRAGESTIGCYTSAYKYFDAVKFYKMSELSIDDLQECMDDCPKGKRTHENMKTLCGLVYKYGIPRGLVPSKINLGEYLIVSGASGSKDGLPLEAVEIIRKNVGIVPGADYVLCQCYLGFRPSEFLALDAKYYNREEKAFVGGAKTDAGRDRVVTISPKIQPIIDRLLHDKIAGPVFCADDGSRMGIAAYRDLFYDVLDRCGIENPITARDKINYHKYTPHSCRHTFATLMKRVKAADKDKLELIGHTDTKMLRHYQDVSFEDLRQITNAM